MRARCAYLVLQMSNTTHNTREGDDMPDPKFSEYIQAAIDGCPLKKKRDTAREAQLRRFRSLSMMEDEGTDAFWFEFDGHRFTAIRKYRGCGLLVLLGNDKRVVKLADIEHVSPLGYARQRKERHGMVDYYTHDKTEKSDRR